MKSLLVVLTALCAFVPQLLDAGDGNIAYSDMPSHQYQTAPQLFPEAYGPMGDQRMLVAEEVTTTLGQFDDLIQVVTLLGTSLANASPVGVVLAIIWIYTRWIQGKPIFKMGSK